MTEVELRHAEDLLSSLAAEGVPFVVVGSLARLWLAEAPLARPPRDVDILVPGDIDSLNRLVGCLIARDFTVRSWTDPVEMPLDPVRLRGRFYLRANDHGGELTVDATYESPLLSFADAWERHFPHGKIAVACTADLARFRWPRE